MDKKTINYFWSFFESLSIENQYLFCKKDGKWFSSKISKNETHFSGELDIGRIAQLSKEIEGCSVYIVHNHPSQEPIPSYPDRFQYAYIQSILALVNIYIEDYLIVSSYGYFSFKEADFLDINKSYQNHPSKSFEIQTPNLGFRVLIDKHKDFLLNTAKEYKEIIFKTHIQYGAASEFDGSFLLKNESSFTNKSIFFKKKNSTLDLIRLKHIDRVLDPIEIYWIDENKIIPLKVEGYI